jgi:hypothetical protein
MRKRAAEEKLRLAGNGLAGHAEGRLILVHKLRGIGVES